MIGRVPGMFPERLKIYAGINQLTGSNLLIFLLESEPQPHHHESEHQDEEITIYRTVVYSYVAVTRVTLHSH